MKILQINTTVNSGSTGRIAEDVGQLLIRSGYESGIGFGRGPGKSASRLFKIGSEKDVLWHGLETMLFDKHGFSSYGATKKFLTAINMWKPDLVHLHNIHGYYLHVGLLFDFLKLHHLPVVWTFHDSWPYTGHCTYFDNIQCERWKTGCYSCPKKRKYPASLLFDRSRQNYLDKKRIFTGVDKMTIVTPSHWLKGHVLNSFLGRYPVKVIHNGVNLSVFHPDGNAADDIIHNKFPHIVHKKVILGVASIWDPRKGLDDFIRLAQMLPSAFLIVLVGLSEKQIKNLPENVLGISRTESVEELAAWYRIATVFANPTWQDNFPTTNIEALACGTPVVTYNTGGSPEAIDDNCGSVVPKGDIEALFSYIKQVAMSGEDLSAVCRQRAISYFNKEERFGEYINLYREMTN